MKHEPAAKDLCTFSPPIVDLALDAETIEHHLGYRESNAPQPVREIIDEILPAVPPRLAPQCGFLVLPPATVAVSVGIVSAGGIQFDTGAIISKQLRESTSLILYVATVGPSMEQWASQLMAEGDMLRGFVVDTIASTAVGLTCDWLEKRIEEHVRPRGWTITNRYSPGYCDWSVADQHKLFSLLPAGFCGITLTPSALMVPIKSLSGILGAGVGVARGAYQCSICDMKDCFQRQDDPASLRGKS